MTIESDLLNEINFSDVISTFFVVKCREKFIRCSGHRDRIVLD